MWPDNDDHQAATNRQIPLFVCLRALVDVAHWVAADELDAHRGHPWLISGPAFAGRLDRLTGTALEPR